jgi:hypothetical protein
MAEEVEMARRGGGTGRPGRKKALGKKVVYTLIGRKEKAGEPMYELLDELVSKHHEHLKGARIALAWHLGWKPDVDGRHTLGKCKKASDLDRELARGENAWDFVIMLDSSWWNNTNVPQAHRRALLDHELCHAQQKLNPRTAEQEEDERGRKIWRTRKHDIEEFSEVVRRHGCYKSELEQFYRDLQQGTRQAELFKEPGKAAATATAH